MPLESCMILLDNSQYMRNGDYLPSRLAAQQDAANLLVSHKTQSNPESTVGIIAMNGGCYTSGVELLVSPTDDVGKLLGALHGIPIRGEGGLDSGVDVPASVQVASLALKHRRNKNGQQRIVIFVGSPLSHVDKKLLVKTGKTLKKNNVKIDVVVMGEVGENEEKLTELVNAANGNSEEKTCHLVTIPAGTLPSDVLIGSPVIHGGDGGGGAGMGMAGAGVDGGAAGNDFAEYGGVDPNLDPELAMVLRISMEEERARQERIARENNESSGDTAEEGNQNNGNTNGDDVNMADTDAQGEEIDVDPDLDPELAMALRMSMAEASQPATSTEAEAPTDTAMMEEDDDGDDDAAMQMALAMSMADGTGENSSEFQDPQFVNQLLGSLPGVDPNDPSIKEAIKELEKSSEDAKGDDKKRDSDEDK